MTGELSIIRTFTGSPVEMRAYPSANKIDDEYSAGITLTRNTDVALLYFNEHGIILRDVVAAQNREVAFTTPPQEYDLPLASGWSNYGVAVSRYSKDQFGQVSVIIDITNAGAIASGSTVATLPAGFRPANPFDAPAIISNDPKGVGKCYFRPNGEIAIAGIGTASWDRVDYFTAQASFVASS